MSGRCDRRRRATFVFLLLPFLLLPFLLLPFLRAPFLRGAAEQAQEVVEAPPQEKQAPDYFPLAVGNRWAYDATYRLATGNTLHATGSLTIEGREVIGGKEYFKAVSRVSGVLGDPETTKYYRRTSTGILEADKRNNGAEFVLLPIPLTHNATWTVESPDELFFGKVTSRQEATFGWKVTHDRREFRDCVLIASNVETRLGSVQHDQWLAPGIGIVRQKQACKLWTMESVLTDFANGSLEP
jgi:hypothetical protein